MTSLKDTFRARLIASKFEEKKGRTVRAAAVRERMRVAGVTLTEVADAFDVATAGISSDLTLCRLAGIVRCEVYMDRKEADNE